MYAATESLLARCIICAPHAPGSHQTLQGMTGGGAALQLDWQPLEPRCSPFGAVLHIAGKRAGGCAAVLECFEADAGAFLRSQLGKSHGLLLLRGVPTDEAQEVLLRLAKLLGTPDDYGALGAGTGRGNVLRLASGLPTQVTTVTLSGNLSRKEVLPPGTLTYPERYGWHTDQSFRSEPADVSLFYCVAPAGDHVASTAFADGVAAYASLPDHRCPHTLIRSPVMYPCKRN